LEKTYGSIQPGFSRKNVFAPGSAFEYDPIIEEERVQDEAEQGP
jgi:hypothetical protein